MTNHRTSGLLLIAGSSGLILALGLHNSGRELFSPDTFESAARNLVAVHSLVLAGMPVWFLGALGLSRRVESADDSSKTLGIAGLVLFGFALASMMTAVVFDGLVTPGVAGGIVHEAAAASQQWKIVLRYNGLIDMAFMHLYLAASSAAIGLWSISMVRSRVWARGLGVFGCVLAPANLIALCSGHVDSHPHVFLMAIFGQALWFMIAGARLWPDQVA